MLTLLQVAIFLYLIVLIIGKGFNPDDLTKKNKCKYLEYFFKYFLSFSFTRKFNLSSILINILL